MKRISESDKWNLKTDDLVIETDAKRTAWVLMRVTRPASNIVCFDRVRILQSDPGKFFDTDTLEQFLVEPGDDIDNFSPDQLDLAAS